MSMARDSASFPAVVQKAEGGDDGSGHRTEETVGRALERGRYKQKEILGARKRI